MAYSKSYKAGEPFRGLLVIINNVDFSRAGMPNRGGSERDVARLRNTFDQLGFEIELHNDQTCGQMLREMTKVAHSPTLEKYDCLVVVILTHGDDNNIIHGVGPNNDSYTIDRVLQPLKDIRKGRGQGIDKEMPKLVFVQACRGENLDRGHIVQTDDSGVNNGGDCIRVPIEADFLYHYSTSPGYYSFRSSTKGSVFIQTICDVYDDHIAKEAEVDVLKAQLEVNGKVAENFTSYIPSDPAFNNMKQMPSFVCMLRKSLLLKKRTA